VRLIKGGKGNDEGDEQRKGIDVHIFVRTENFDFEKNATVDTIDELEKVLSDVPSDLQQVSGIFAQNEFDEMEEDD
jgi:hypothetical protein